MRISIKHLIVFCLLITTYSNCKKGGSTSEPPVPDTTNPTISIIKPTAGQAFVPENSIAFQASFADNNNVKSYSITITKFIAGGFILKNVSVPVVWSYTKSATNFTTGIKQQDITLNDIVIPTDISGSPVSTGDYNFKVTCMDDAGNTASTTLIIKIN